MDKKNIKNKEKICRNKKTKDITGGKSMATQIAATPILYGEEAKKIMREAKTSPSEKSKQNAKNMIIYFNKFIKKGE